ncbi:MAG: coproporphyrinogen dehydrogenase HemZ [Oscillospiraceae bacterium]|nr:coproporphyrinogen dehydrogenase HemZ [Oscillospiraceae bacterium]
MELQFIGHDYKYAVEQIMLMLFPGETPTYPEKFSGALCAKVSLTRGENLTTAVTVIKNGGNSYVGRASIKSSELDGGSGEIGLLHRIVRFSFYRAGVRCLGGKPEWGALSGVRPGKLMAKVLETAPNDKAAVSEFIRLYDVSPRRAKLCLDTSKYTLSAAQSLEARDVCLYLGVPFCPTRCAYCSFVSQTVEKSMKLIPPFVDALLKDIEATGEAVKAAGLRIAAVYYGGGTPTTLSAEQLDLVCGKMQECFDLSACREFTVEAGRPDTISIEKLEVLKRRGVTRVSVNPQTMDDAVLETIGRRHTAQEVIDALALVREVGGIEVNMDLIAGLPADTPETFKKTLETVIALDPENITVHTLALKKGSRITLEGTRIPTAEEVSEMLDFAESALRGEDYEPYYLFRQKYMSGGFENVGWCKKGTENFYNICIMEELCSIVSMGAGASTKLVSVSGEMERFFAPKYPLEYINGIDKICADKSKVKEFDYGLQS